MEEDNADKTPRINPGYALGQIARALATAKQHPDTATRERAATRVTRWRETLQGILDGSLQIGSRTPLPGTPPWVTLEVLTGGFSSGRMLAAGPLQDHERAWLRDFPDTPEAEARRLLNGYFLGEAGLAQLQTLLDSGRYDIQLPEEGALLVVAWLTRHDHAGSARELLETLGPWLAVLRFYPVPSERPRRAGNQVHVQDVGTVRTTLENLEPNPQILAQKEAIQIWAPLYDRTVGLFLETVAGEVPDMRRDADGAWQRDADGRFPVMGGWPCQHYPPDWHERARTLLDDYRRLRQQHRYCGKPDRASEGFARLRGYLARILQDSASLDGREVGRIRMLLARYVARRGAPDSQRWRAHRERQRRQAAPPGYHEIARVVAARLASLPGDEGLDEPEALLQPVTAAEAARFPMPAQTPVPRSLRIKVSRAQRDTVEALVARGLISSAETLARVLPQLTAGINAAGFEDPALRHLYGALYRAFRQRRSLLLLNLEHQVRLEELPWVAALEPFRQARLPARELARQSLVEVVLLALQAFPQAILPNKLLQELTALARRAGLDLPLVEEVAADIFMGQFSPKFLAAARRAADLLEGNLYARYYRIDYAALRALPETPRHRGRGLFAGLRAGPVPADGFLALCETRAGVRHGGWRATDNGMIIEQQQILTTQNLAVLFQALALAPQLGDGLEDLPRRCFAWLCQRLQIPVTDRHSRLIQIKNAAYAWRQMVFFLALLPEERLRGFLDWAAEHLQAQAAPFRARFGPLLEGLETAAAGGETEPFLGWTRGEHRLLADDS